MDDVEYKQILEAADEAIITLDDDYLIILFNDGAQGLFGYSSKEALGAPLNTLIPERFHDTHGRHLRRFAAEHASTRKMNERGRIVGRRKNGEEFSALASILKTTSAQGVRHYTVIMRDISEMTRATDHLHIKVRALEKENYHLTESRKKREQAEFLLDHLLRESHSYPTRHQ